MSREELGRKDSFLAGRARGGVFFPKDLHLNPMRLVKGLGRVLRESGVKVHEQTEVWSLKAERGRIANVRTSAGDFHPQHVVLAGGAWSPLLAKDTGVRLPIQPAKGYSLTLPKPANAPATPMILTEAKVTVTPFADGLRFAGTLELAGLDPSVNRARVGPILREAARYFPGLDPEHFPLEKIWSGYRPCSPDGLPLIGRAGHLENLFVATGHAMLGITLGPITAHILADLLEGRAPTVDPTPLSPTRFK